MSTLRKMVFNIRVIVFMIYLPCVSAHGLMLWPPSRQSAWRVGYYELNRINYNDNQLYCGGIKVQWDENGGKCGICGDSWSSFPREYEHPDGAFVHNVSPVYSPYLKGETLEIVIDLTANHKGYFEFRLCNRDNLLTPDATPECLNENLLKLDGGLTRYYVTTNRTGKYVIKAQLPLYLTCNKCLLQWKYHAGNNWGCWDDVNCCTGCGERQEEFYACADILIHSNASPESVTPTTSATESTSAPPPSAPLSSAETLNLSTLSEGNQSTTTPRSTAICKPDILLDSICKGSGTSCYIYCKGSLAPFLCRGLCSPCYEYLKVCANK